MITLAEAARAAGGDWLAAPLPPGTPLRSGGADTRALAGTEIFFALKGEHGDGHDFLPRLAGGAVRLAVVGRDVAIPGFEGNILRVEEPLAALAGMAAFVVRKFAPAVVAVTGSYGKTTAKEVIAHVLSGGRKVLKTPGSHNNEIGLPLALLGLDGSQDTAVVEFSARKEGDLDYLGRIAPPAVAVLTVVGSAHIGVFGSREAIYRAKGEIFNHLAAQGLAVVGAGDPRLRVLAGERRTVTFGRGAADFRAEDITTDGLGRQSFTGLHAGRRLALRSAIPGPHGLEPILAAWAVAAELGVPDEEVGARAYFDPAQKGRAVITHTPGGATLLDDTYNASPETVVNLIETLATMAGQERILVLGHLAELEQGLGDSARAIAGSLRPPLDRVFVHAPASPGLAKQLAALAPRGPGAGPCEVRDFEEAGELVAALRELDAPGLVIGVKGARSAHMERIVEGMKGVEVACGLRSCGLLRSCTDCGAITGAG